MFIKANSKHLNKKCMENKENTFVKHAERNYTSLKMYVFILFLINLLQYRTGQEITKELTFVSMWGLNRHASVLPCKFILESCLNENEKLLIYIKCVRHKNFITYDNICAKSR